MEYAKHNKHDLFVAFMDYEKAFDFMNRAKLIEKMMNHNMGKKLIEATANMYSYTAYIPKESNTTLGDKIETKHGVTQGKVSSANLYSFYVSDMPDCLKDNICDFMDPFNLAQLADDTATFACSLLSLRDRIIQLLRYSKENFQEANIDKTKYLHLSDNPTTDPIIIDDSQRIDSAHDKGYVYIGMLFIASILIEKQIVANINARMGNIHKFYAWLEYNMSTPIKIKLLVLYNCTFSALLYGVETWWDIECFSERISLIERKALRRCLGIKSSTPDNLLFIELNRGDIISDILDRQSKFFKKLLSLPKEECLVRNLMELCNELDIIKHYEDLSNNNKNNNLAKKKSDTENSTSSMTKRYHELTNNEYNPAIYESFMKEELRIILTRWRLSCHTLEIQTGRFKDIPREERLCIWCNVLGDEEHAIFVCRAYTSIRTQFKDLLNENKSIRGVLNPKDRSTAEQVGLMLKLIEERRKKLL